MPRSLSTGPTQALHSADALSRALARVMQRARIANALGAGAAASGVAAIGTLAGHAGLSWAAGIAAATLMFWMRRGMRTPGGAARLIERAGPDCRNVVITAEELLRHPERAAPWICARVVSDAAGSAASVSCASAVPLLRPTVIFLASASLSAVLFVVRPPAASHAIRDAVSRLSKASGVSAASPLRIVATVTPPAYTGLSTSAHTNPERIDAVQGSAVRLVITGPARAWRIRYGTRGLSPTQRGAETVAETVLSESGYFAIEPLDEHAARDRRLVPVAVTPDRVPVIRVDTPGRDLLLPDTRSPVPVAVSASDDFGLQSLELRYTKVSGTGEQFEFEEGLLPLGVTRESGVAWKGSGRIAVRSMKLEPGDALVYRAVARDRRPGDAGQASSDTFFIEIAGPGQVAVEGFEMPPDQERYALSQQMIVLKIQRLRARERPLPRAALEEAAAAIAAEQRAVRSNFIFLMGGHVEDEEEEAEQSSEIAEGRLQNTARKEINAATAHMSRSEQALIAVDTAAALPPARAAVEALQRAFGRNRYILRTMPVRSRVDPSRRLTGELSAAGDWRRELPPAAVDRETADARALLSKLLEIAAVVRAGGRVDPGALTALAEQALAIDPGSAPWQDVARRLGDARDRVAAGRPPTGLSDAIAPVIARARRGARLAPGPGTRAPGALLSAWAEESRR